MLPYLVAESLRECQACGVFLGSDNDTRRGESGKRLVDAVNIFFLEVVMIRECKHVGCIASGFFDVFQHLERRGDASEQQDVMIAKAVWNHSVVWTDGKRFRFIGEYRI